MATQTIVLSGSETFTGAPAGDDFVITDNGVGSNTVTLGNGTDQITLGNGGSNTLTLGTGNDQITVGGPSNTITTGTGNSVITVAGDSNTITVGAGSNTIALGSGGLDTVHTGAGNNVVSATAAGIGGDTILGALSTGDGSTNQLVVTTTGIISPTSVSGFQSYQLANGGANTLTLAAGNFVRLPGMSITVQGGDSGNTVNAASLAAPDSVVINGGGGPDRLTGGAGNDTFNEGSGADTATGGAGGDIFGFGSVALGAAQASPAVLGEITDYDQGGSGSFNAAEGDQINLATLVSASYNHGGGQPVASLVRVVEGAGGTFANLEIDPDGTGTGINWVTIARLDALQPGEGVNVILDPSLPAGTSIAVANPPLFEYVSSGQTLDGSTVLSGDYLIVLAGGTTNATTVTSGGAEVVSGQANGTIISSGGADYVQSGGTASGTTMASGGVEFVEIGGTSIATVANGGVQMVYGAASGTVLNSGAFQYLETGSTVGTVVTNGVEVIVATAIGTIDAVSGKDFVFAGGVASGTVVNGGVEYVETNAHTIGTMLNSGAQVVYGTATSTVLNSAAEDYVEAGGTAIGTIVNSGAMLVFGTASGTIDQATGADYIYSGGVASGTTVRGGNEFVEINGIAIGTTVDGGSQVVYGTASGTNLNSGVQVVEAGGSASATGVASGGYEYVASGGIATATTISGGTLELVGGAGGSIGFMAAGNVILDMSVLFSGTVAGFGTSLTDTIDLRDVVYNSATTTKSYSGNASSGTLTVNNGFGTATANLALLGQYAAGNFTLSTDGHGGTLVTDPPLTAAAHSDPATLGAAQHG